MLPLQPHPTAEPIPYAGWAFKAAVELDRACPGFLAATYYFSPAKRQAAFLTMAALRWEQPEAIAERLGRLDPNICEPGTGPLAVIARAVITLPAKRIVSAVLGLERLPNGLMGTLSRLGPDPLGVSHYSYCDLVRTFASDTPIDRARTKVLMQISGPVSHSIVAVTRTLDPILLHPNVVMTTHGTIEAIALNRALAFIRERCSTANERNLRESIRVYGPNRKMKPWVQNWIRQAADRMPWPSPVEDDPAFIPLSTAAALIEAGKRLSLCLDTKIAEVALGRFFFMEYRPADAAESVVVELRRVSTGWLLEGCHSRANNSVASTTAAMIRQKLMEHGVITYKRLSGDGLADVARLLGVWAFAEIEGEEFDPEPALEALETGGLEDSL